MTTTERSIIETERLLQVTRENFEAECTDIDKVLALFPDLRRSESGRLPIAGMVNAICDLSERCKANDVRLDWLEQLVIPSEEINDLVRNWKINGKRYAEGIRIAIDAAMKVWPGND